MLIVCLVVNQNILKGIETVWNSVDISWATVNMAYQTSETLSEWFFSIRVLTHTHEDFAHAANSKFRVLFNCFVSPFIRHSCNPVTWSDFLEEFPS